MHVDKKDTTRLFFRKPEGKRPVGTPRHVWEGNIKMDLRGMEYVVLAYYSG
jgi:hypothetical protein